MDNDARARLLALEAATFPSRNALWQWDAPAPLRRLRDRRDVEENEAQITDGGLIGTYGLVSCWAFVLWDKTASRAMLAHVDFLTTPSSLRVLFAAMDGGSPLIAFLLGSHGADLDTGAAILQVIEKEAMEGRRVEIGGVMRIENISYCAFDSKDGVFTHELLHAPDPHTPAYALDGQHP